MSTLDVTTLISEDWIGVKTSHFGPPHLSPIRSARVVSREIVYATHGYHSEYLACFGGGGGGGGDAIVKVLSSFTVT